MITKYKQDYRFQRKNYDTGIDLDYISQDVMINDRQRRTLVDLISRNCQGDDRENRLLELDNITSLEAEEQILQYVSASWH